MARTSFILVRWWW